MDNAQKVEVAAEGVGGDDAVVEVHCNLLTDEKTGKSYYIHCNSGDTHWELPQVEEGEQLIVWERKVDEETGNAYYVNIETGQSRWETVWETYNTEDSLVFYFNNITRNSQWEPPEWIDYVDGNGNLYYENSISGEVQWEVPKCFEQFECTILDGSDSSEFETTTRSSTKRSREHDAQSSDLVTPSDLSHEEEVIGVEAIAKKTRVQPPHTPSTSTADLKPEVDTLLKGASS